MRVKLLTLGCKVNRAETEALDRLLRAAGHEIVSAGEPEALILNTCAVTGASAGKSRRLTRRLRREHPSACLIVTGCWTQLQSAEAAALGADFVLGTQERAAAADCLNIWAAGGERAAAQMVRPYGDRAEYEELAAPAASGPVRAMLKIQDGCGGGCAYCAVPSARGPSRSRAPEAALAEAAALVAAGAREIVLTGINIGLYGQENGAAAGWDLGGLARAVAAVPGLLRLRLGSLEPQDCTEKLVQTMSDLPVFCPHWHLPLQSGANSVLARMGRVYWTEDYRRALELLRAAWPEAAVTADVMAGFPGETAEEHETSRRFIAGCDLAGLHVFPFSRREGTAAAALPDEPRSRKDARVRDLLAVGAAARAAYCGRHIGREAKILLEYVDLAGKSGGHTENYINVTLPAVLNPGDWRPGRVVTAALREEYITGVKEDVNTDG
ncbi:MAG: MiaB/RimO family radical SAM methylthiotransferase [Gracilibacteraceae bacterium]|jgi:threonylcarbamoyladenosine tRNA methylthiotransferase MtaB|nr:MiaB/RimO family radical SAM methylthiotransferase [Gracilibacteraceae bacterium]